jgi:hypothetical protein
MRRPGLIKLAALLVLSSSAVGCFVEPQGACYYRREDGGKGCRDTTASECDLTWADEFKEDESCLVWDLLHPPT